ncbi:MAG: glycosyltransferase family 2 protein [Pseudomonadota bacterium]
MPHFSIIIPTYNDDATLPRTLATALAQDLDDFEVVVVNDAGRSPRDLIARVGPRPRLIEMATNGGVSAARNRGLAESTGDIVLFLDADDCIAPDLLSFAAGGLADPAIDVLVVDHHTVPSAEMETALARLAPGPRETALDRPDPVGLYDRVRRRSGQFIPSAALFRRTALVARRGPAPWREGLTNSEDTLLFLQMAVHHPMALSDEKLVLYNRRPDSASADPTRAWTGRIAAMDALVAGLLDDGADPRLIAVARRMRQNAARRTARLTVDRGTRRALLRDDLRAGFNWKTVLEMMRP